MTTINWIDEVAQQAAAAQAQWQQAALRQLDATLREMGRSSSRPVVNINTSEPSANTQAQDGAFAEGGVEGPRRITFDVDNTSQHEKAARAKSEGFMIGLKESLADCGNELHSCQQTKGSAFQIENNAARTCTGSLMGYSFL